MKINLLGNCDRRKRVYGFNGRSMITRETSTETLGFLNPLFRPEILKTTNKSDINPFVIVISRPTIMFGTRIRSLYKQDFLISGNVLNVTK